MSLVFVSSIGCQAADKPHGAHARQAITGDNVTYEPDCNDPGSSNPACIHPTRAIIEDAQAQGYPYYIGHAEPTAEFFSRAGTSGSNMQWKFQLPATDPAPAQDGSSVANFELYGTIWLGLALCDPNSNPGGACTAASDSNNLSSGAAFLELQFYPPGSPFGGCSDSQWCVRLHINTLQQFTAFQKVNCLEPTTQQYVTTDGTVGGSRLLMNTGDSLLVTIKDTAGGLETDVQDLTLGTSGAMVASGANGFVHNKNQTDCDTEAFDFHAMYTTASPGQIVPWAALQPNVSFDFEIGHFELCGDASCSKKPDGADADDASCSTVRGVGGCFASDTDQDGVCYQANWPDGTAAHPASAIVGSPDDRGVGPLSATLAAPSIYDSGYGSIRFATTEGTATTFYPFFSQAGTGTACRFDFGNTIPGVTTNDFGKATQYGTTIDNPCAPGLLATSLTYDGDTTADFHDPATLAARLVDLDTGTPVSGATISFALGAQSCSAVTTGTGQASCTITITQPPGAYVVIASFAGDSSHRASTTSVPFSVTREESSITSTDTLQAVAQNGSATLSATLTEDGITPIPGRTVTISLGSGAGAQSCSAVTDLAGVATCTISPVTVGLGPQPITDSFTGDAFYLPSTHAQRALVFRFLTSGSFVVGDLTASTGGTVTWWGAQWAKDNRLSGGPAPSAFKGFADGTSEPPACGDSWTAAPGSSAPPPPANSIPSYMGVIVSSRVSASGSTISGDAPQIVVIQTNPGYAPSAGHPGTGVIVAQFCP